MSEKRARPRTYYLRAGGHLPCNIGFCDSEKALQREWKYLTDDPVGHSWCDENGARVWVFPNPKANRYRTYLICIRFDEHLTWPGRRRYCSHGEGVVRRPKRKNARKHLCCGRNSNRVFPTMTIHRQMSTGHSINPLPCWLWRDDVEGSDSCLQDHGIRRVLPSGQ